MGINRGQSPMGSKKFRSLEVWRRQAVGTPRRGVRKLGSFNGRSVRTARSLPGDPTGGREGKGRGLSPRAKKEMRLRCGRNRKNGTYASGRLSEASAKRDHSTGVQCGRLPKGAYRRREGKGRGLSPRAKKEMRLWCGRNRESGNQPGTVPAKGVRCGRLGEPSLPREAYRGGAIPRGPRRK